jgi:hypothetical protein
MRAALRPFLLLGSMAAAVACGGAKEPAGEERRPAAAPAQPADAGEVEAKPSAPSVESVASPAPERAAEPSAAAADVGVAPSDEPTQTWSCLCYARVVGDGQEPVSACRASASECTALQRRVARGGRGIVKGSLTRPCTEVIAAHPGDALGGRELWTPSSRPGAWLSLGSCHVGGGDPRADEVGDDPELSAEEARDEARMDKIYETESIGPLRPGMSDAEVVAAVGEPKERGEAYEEAATGDYVQTWRYADGLSVDLLGDSRRGPWHVGGISIAPPSKLKTARGVGLGTPREEAIRAYKDLLSEDVADNEENVVAGSLYGGLFMAFAGAGVDTIYLGRGAE